MREMVSAFQTQLPRHEVEMMAERGLPLAHTTIMRWVHHYAPGFERRWNRFARPAGSSWRCRRDLREDPWLKWVIAIPAVDGAPVQTGVDFRLSGKARRRRGQRRFFREAIKTTGSTPRTITLDRRRRIGRCG